MQEDEKIQNWNEKISDFLNSRYFIAIVVVLLIIIAFCLGRISGLQDKRPGVRIVSDVGGEVKGVSTNNSPSGKARPPTLEAVGDSGRVVASKNGTKYHFPWCAGAKQISPQNLITFNSTAEARTKGYTPASNCKGLK